MQLIYRLPSNQDYHEMWSRKRRKEKEKAAIAAAAVNNKQGRNIKEDSSNSTHNKHHQHHDMLRPSSGGGALSPSPRRREGSNPPPTLGGHKSRGFSTEPLPPLPTHTAEQGGIKPQLSVPRPSAPLPKAILESLVDGIGIGGVAGESSVATSASSTTASLQMKQVIAEAQRSLINQLQQQLEGSTSNHPHTHTSSCNSDKYVNDNELLGGTEQRREGFDLERRTQTFDYANQSNKELERVADKELQMNYYR